MVALIKLNKEFLKEEMSKRGIKSINEMAREIGISESMLNLLMRGERNPGSKVIRMMISYFKADFEKIFDAC